ncbi:MAG: hypothetical protein QM785_03525 [Pyrinomonadaceae bacterium]
MKQCPSCLTTYPDETLRFCLADGSVLTAIDDEQSTVIRTARNKVAEETLAINSPVRVDIPSAADQPTEVAPVGIPHDRTASNKGSGGIVLKIVIAVIAFIFLGLLLAGAAGALFYFNSGKSDPPANPANVRQPAQPSPTATKDDRDDLRDQIANLQKQLNEQKKATLPANGQITIPKTSTTTTTARANSPSDGFLALRSLPSSEIGERILKIPHGATVTIGACGPVVKPVSRSGRWCQASYNGVSGWVFDAYLEY